MKFIDIHTHSRNRENHAILNCDINEADTLPCSIGIHPCDITPLWQEKFREIAENAIRENIVAIGECGFDFSKSTATSKLQEEVFRAHVELSKATEKPLIIHLVKGQEHLLNVAKSINHRQAWIIHGFRGKPEQAKQLLSHNMFLSFGSYFNEKSIEITPLERIFIETDESNETIESIYKRIAKIKGMEAEDLCRQINENALHCKISFH